MAHTESIHTEEDILELHIYNTMKAIKHELITIKNIPRPDALQRFIDTLRQIHRLKYFVGTAVYMPTASHVYLSSEDENWVEMVCMDQTGPLMDPSEVNVITGDPCYPEGRFVGLSVFNTTGEGVYQSMKPRNNSAVHARLLRRSLEALTYCHRKQFTIQNVIYTDDDATINISTTDTTWVQGLDEVLRGLP